MHLDLNQRDTAGTRPFDERASLMHRMEERRTDGIATIQWFGCRMSSIWKQASLKGPKAFIKSCCNWTHSTSSGEYDWGEGGMLYVPDTLLICSLFFFFMSAVASTGCGCGVRWSKWVENSDIVFFFFFFSKWPPQ